LEGEWGGEVSWVVSIVAVFGGGVDVGEGDVEGDDVIVVGK
jgi:hypothetical protein